jgi:EPS-associated MarR family transcriptional regulator
LGEVGVRLQRSNDVGAKRKQLTDGAVKSQEDARFRVLNLLQKHPDLSQRELANMLGVSLGQVNFVLKALVDKGLVKVGNFRKSNNRLRYMYILTPKGAAEKVALTAKFLARKLKEYEALKAEIEALRQETEAVTDTTRASGEPRL